MANESNFSTALGKITQIDPSRPRGDSVTYVWQVFSEKTNQYYDCTEEYLYSKDGPFSKKERPEFVEVILFENANHFIYQLPYFEEYFSIPFGQGGMSVGKRDRNFYYRLVISRPEFDKLHTLIQSAGLGKIEGLLFEIIILAQEITARMPSNSNYPQTANQILSAKTETNRLIEIIETTLFDKQRWYRNMPPNSVQKLNGINFIFESRKPILIKNTWLIDKLIRIIRDHYDGMAYKYWRLELLALPKIFENLSKQSKFGKLLAQSYYNFLIKEKLVSIDSPYPNDLMFLISELLSFSYIYSGEKDDDKSEDVNRIRTWVTRRIALNPFSLSRGAHPNLDFLGKYFDKPFITLGDPKDYGDTLGIAKFLCTRFNLPAEIQPEIMHISACIRAANRIIGYQFTNTSSDNIQIPEFQSLRELIQGFKDGRKITSINIRMDNQVGNYEFNHRMPLYLLEQAIHSYYETNTVEFESNIIKTRAEMDSENEFKIMEQSRFNLPNERFFVRHTHSLFNYLDVVIESYTAPYERYILEIITALYQHNGVFRNGSEEFLVNKVTNWYYLDAES